MLWIYPEKQLLTLSPLRGGGQRGGGLCPLLHPNPQLQRKGLPQFQARGDSGCARPSLLPPSRAPAAGGFALAIVLGGQSPGA